MVVLGVVVVVVVVVFLGYGFRELNSGEMGAKRKIKRQKKRMKESLTFVS